MSSNCASTPRNEFASIVRACACLSAGKDVDHAIDRLARIVRVQRSENQQAGLRRGQRERDGFQIAHLADEHDVGIFAQRRFQSDRETIRNRSGTSRCVMTLRLLSCTNSIGSSIVTMWREKFSLM